MFCGIGWVCEGNTPIPMFWWCQNRPLMYGLMLNLETGNQEQTLRANCFMKIPTTCIDLWFTCVDSGSKIQHCITFGRAHVDLMVDSILEEWKTWYASTYVLLWSTHGKIKFLFTYFRSAHANIWGQLTLGVKISYACIDACPMQRSMHGVRNMSLICLEKARVDWAFYGGRPLAVFDKLFATAEG